MTVREYIKDNWNVFTDKSGYIPYPYTPPCFSDGAFNILFYWDTFFTNEGLIADGRINQARDNVNNLIYFLNKFGCVPNMTRETGADYASQPPLLYLMIKRLMEVEPNARWERGVICALEKEYKFWMTERIAPCGLNRYGTNMKDRQTLIKGFEETRKRIPLPTNLSDDEKVASAISLIAEGESGEDHTPRFDHRAAEYAAVGLNSHLYGLEEFLENYFIDKNKEKSESYKSAKLKRVALMKKFMEDEDGVYHDYRFTDGIRSKIYASACFLPYMVGIATKGINVLVDKLSYEIGFRSCENIGVEGCQWGYLYAWPPHQYFAFNALLRTNRKEVAEDHAGRYMRIVEETFDRTGFLWEKYEVKGVAKGEEYPTQIMMGWTAGVYNVFYDYFAKKSAE